AEGGAVAHARVRGVLPCGGEAAAGRAPQREIELLHAVAAFADEGVAVAAFELGEPVAAAALVGGGAAVERADAVADALPRFLDAAREIVVRLGGGCRRRLGRGARPWRGARLGRGGGLRRRGVGIRGLARLRRRRPGAGLRKFRISGRGRGGLGDRPG